MFNTCAVRENADNRLYGNLGHLLPVKNAHPGMQIAVGGCLAQKDRAAITERAPWVDVVFGTHNIGSLPVLLERARVQEQAQVEIVESLERFPSVLPVSRESAVLGLGRHLGRLQQHLHVLHRAEPARQEEDRRPGDVLAEIRALVADGVLEVTLLGQNVNSYGVGFGDRLAFGKLLRACGEIDGLERVRFTSPHPRDFTDDVIEAMAADAERHAAAAHAAAVRLGRGAAGHAPRLPPGQVPGHHRPGPGRDAGRGDHHRHHRRLPRRDRAGLRRHARRGPRGPGSRARSRSSTRSGRARPRPSMPDQVPPDVVADRYERLAALVDEISWAENQKLVGTQVEVLVADGEGPQGRARPTGCRAGPGTTGWCTSRRPSTAPRPGDCTTVVTSAAPHYLLADGAPLSSAAHPRRRRLAGPASVRRPGRQRGRRPAVLLGMPTLGALLAAGAGGPSLIVVPAALVVLPDWLVAAESNSSSSSSGTKHRT